MIPNIAKEFLLKIKEEQGCLCLSIDNNLNIIEFSGKQALLGANASMLNQSIFDVLPGVLTENFNSNFEIPFYNVNENHVCNVYFLKHTEISYLLLVDKSEIYQVTQKYQQFAHDDNISKNKFKRLAQELEKAQTKLKKSNREKATLIAMLSHELGTPLTSILGYSELLLKDRKDIQKGLMIINRNAIYLRHMIENTLLFGKSEADEMPILVTEEPVQKLFNQLKANLLPAAQSKNLALQMYHRGDDVINIDSVRTQQILINLLNNAVKYTEEGSIELRFSTKNNKYIFSVIDTGIGVPQHLQKTIFNPWERVEESTEKGSGIGLFISMNLTKAIGGELILKHSSALSGSIFQLIIPWHPLTESIKKPCIGEECDDKTILVIDDDSDILDLIEAILTSNKMNVFSALNFPEAEKHLQNQKIDLVLSDLNIGIIKATSFINKIKKINNTLPVILMTAMPSSNEKNNYKKQGFNEVVIKPLNSENLIKTIHKYL